MKNKMEKVFPNAFESENHFYSKVLNAHINPMTRHFMNLSRDRVLERYSHLHPEVDKEALQNVLEYNAKYFKWGGSDIIHATSSRGERRCVVIETNSCPSGQKSMPILDEDREAGGYERLIERCFMPLIADQDLASGEIAVIYDKNYMEASGYAAVIADRLNRPVYLVSWYDGQPRAKDPLTIGESGYLEIEIAGVIRPVKAAFRYLTQRPWNRLPVNCKTLMLNPVLVCLAGGRNKSLAAKAYESLNRELSGTGLKIHTPDTIWNVAKAQVPSWIARLGGKGVVKVPYSNAGQGVYIITSERDLQAFLQEDFYYEKFIVQSLIGNFAWSSSTADKNPLFHIGTMPNRHKEIYVVDMRFMVGNAPDGFHPICIYGRRALLPLVRNLEENTDSWAMLGTNLSKKISANEWTTDESRLLMMDSRNFNLLGFGIDDLFEAYIQTLLAIIAIDKMADRLLGEAQTFDQDIFASLVLDQRLIDEIKV